MDLAEHLIAEFSASAGLGAALELRMRLLCGIVPALAPFSTAHQLESVEAAIAGHFESLLTDDERRVLSQARQLRNKILHADFHDARGKLREIDGAESNEVVRVVTLDPGKELEQVTSIARAPHNAGTPIAGTGSTAEGTVFAWLLEFSASGEFGRVTRVFADATVIIDRLRASTEG